MHNEYTYSLSVYKPGIQPIEQVALHTELTSTMKRIDLGFLLLVTCVQLLERSVGGQAAAVALTTIPKCTGGAGVEACVPLLTTRTLAGTIITRGSDGCKVVVSLSLWH